MSDTENAAVSDSENITQADSHPELNLALQDPVPTPRTLFEDKTQHGTHEKSDISVNIYENADSKQENGEAENDEKEDEEVADKKDSEKPLLDEESVTIDIIRPGYEGEDTPTLPLPDKGKKSKIDCESLEKKQKEKLPVHLFPFARIKKAWNESTNVFSFFGAAVCIIFQTVGWFTCVGGVPFLSLVMLIIGSIYVGQCNIEPNIPVYLIVSGVIGTIQHVLTIWTRYVPKESHGRLRVYRSYCNSINGLFHIFLIIWFILGCVWVYSAHSEVDFRDPYKDEYCHKTLYYFAFWILNLSFILFGLLVVLSVCFLVLVIVTPKEEQKGIVQ